MHTTGPDGPGGWAHPRRFLHINAGVLLFRIFDQAAYTSTMAVLGNAAALADVALSPTAGEAVRP